MSDSINVVAAKASCACSRRKTSIRSNIIIFPEDQTWSGNGAPLSRLSRPLLKFDHQIRTNELMIQMRLFRRVEFPIDNLVSLSIVGKSVEIG